MAAVTWKIASPKQRPTCVDCDRAAGIAGMLQVASTTDPRVQPGETLCARCQNSRFSQPLLAEAPLAPVTALPAVPHPNDLSLTA